MLEDRGRRAQKEKTVTKEHVVAANSVRSRWIECFYILSISRVLCSLLCGKKRCNVNL